MSNTTSQDATPQQNLPQGPTVSGLADALGYGEAGAAIGEAMFPLGGGVAGAAAGAVVSICENGL